MLSRNYACDISLQYFTILHLKQTSVLCFTTFGKKSFLGDDNYDIRCGGPSVCYDFTWEKSSK